MSPRNIFEHELEELKKDLEEMSRQVECAYDNLFDAIAIKDEATILRIMKNDRNVNNMERNIETKCLSLITRQQPVAKDLRLVTAALKVVTDLERVGDNVADIAELILRLNMADLTGYSAHLAPMIEATKQLIHDAVNAFVNRDMEAAQKVIDGDDVIDELFNKAKGDIVHFLQSDTKNADECVDILMIAKYLEKIGDHAVNIGEWEIFQETGAIENIRVF